jgi:hypothetical protein
LAGKITITKNGDGRAQSVGRVILLFVFAPMLFLFVLFPNPYISAAARCLITQANVDWFHESKIPQTF